MICRSRKKKRVEIIYPSLAETQAIDHAGAGKISTKTARFLRISLAEEHFGKEYSEWFAGDACAVSWRLTAA